MNGKVKLVVVGDSAVGKILSGYADNISIGSETWTFALWDNHGQEEQDRLRPYLYADADVFLVCFSVALPASLENAQKKWLPEIRHCSEPGVPFVLVATQIDLRREDGSGRLGSTPISTAQGERMAHQLGAAKYLECSAKTREGVQTVFDEVIVIAITYKKTLEQSKQPKNGPRKCIIL
ncbi:Cell division control protein 42 [Mycena sanguinolenta]|uniref:Cell division control protein 42 n=1 Tax=Mycena sanguinolenta TaxID=230812 RepID=A0A8H7CNR2_9AGAR|nr:Cell division control protein 42 [Mycena sanguinolenta]